MNKINVIHQRKEPQRENHQRGYCRYFGAITVVIIKENPIHTANLQRHTNTNGDFSFFFFKIVHPGVLLYSI